MSYTSVHGSEVEPTGDGSEGGPVALDLSPEGFDAAAAFEALVGMDREEMDRSWRLLRPEQVEAIKVHAEQVAPAPVVDDDDDLAREDGDLDEIEPEGSSIAAAAPPAPFAEDGFVPVAATDPKYRPIVDRATAIARAAVRSLEGEAREQVAALIAQAEQYPADRPEYGAAMQRAEYLAQGAHDPGYRGSLPDTWHGEPPKVAPPFSGPWKPQKNESLADANDSADFGERVTPEDVGSWPMDKMLRFMEQHPDAWEQIKAGGNVAYEPSLPAGPPEAKSDRPIWLGAR